MLGRPRESAALRQAGLDAVRRFGIDLTVLAANRIEALLAIGEWDEADRASAQALRSITASYTHLRLIIRADLEVVPASDERQKHHSVRPVASDA
jgi:hypothetical protein